MFHPDLTRFLKPHPMDDLGPDPSLVPAVKTVKDIVHVVQNSLLHEHMAKPAYGITLDATRRRESWHRSVSEKLAWMQAQGWRSLADPRAPQDRMVGICRDYSLLAVSLLRRAGIPARARCGFGLYLSPPKGIDHWVVEWWDGDRGAWRLTDAQLDPAQSQALGNPIDPFDVSRSEFVTADHAWRECRAGLRDPSLYGIFRWWGFDYLGCNLLLDANSLLGVPLQPWDLWPGPKAQTSAEWTPEAWSALDRLADLESRIDQDFEAFATHMKETPGLQAPEDWSQIVNSLESAPV